MEWHPFPANMTLSEVLGGRQMPHTANNQQHGNTSSLPFNLKQYLLHS